MEERQAEAFERLREELMPFWQKYQDEKRKVAEHNAVVFKLVGAIEQAGGRAHAQVPFEEDGVISKMQPAITRDEYDMGEPGGRTYLYEVTNLAFTQDIVRPRVPDGELLNPELGRKLHDEYVKRWIPPGETLLPGHTGPLMVDSRECIDDACRVVIAWMEEER